MRLIRDDGAYRRLLDDFVAQRVGAAVFIARFRHLWACDGAQGIDSVPATGGAPDDRPGLPGALEAIGDLCETFARSLAPGCGYRVSEEQFRKEVQGLASALPLARAGRV
jgi:hypothetical protein